MISTVVASVKATCLLEQFPESQVIVVIQQYFTHYVSLLCFPLFCLPLQFGALLKLYWDPKLKLGKATPRQSKAAAVENKQ